MDKSYFYFKSFKLLNQRSAFKINTDGVLLGAWARLRHSKSILDIGTGGGVIAFMAGEKNPKAMITGIDIDGLSIQEACENAALNESQNIAFQHVSLQDFPMDVNLAYDHIISNPPFFDSGDSSGNIHDKRKWAAKQDSSLKLDELVSCSARLLCIGGKLSLVIPYDKLGWLRQYSAQEGLHITRLTKVRGITDGEYKRVLIEMSNEESDRIEENEMAIRKNEQSANGKNPFTEAYMKLTQPYYLNF